LPIRHRRDEKVERQTVGLSLSSGVPLTFVASYTLPAESFLMGNNHIILGDGEEVSRRHASELKGLQV
jgi:hypothetical protein